MIEKIGYSRPSLATRAPKRTGSAGSSQFSATLSEVSHAAESDSIRPLSATSMFGSIISAQEVDEREARRRQSLKQGRVTLEHLEKLRDGLLMGMVPIATIHALEQWVIQEKTQTNDPVLRSILNDIEVRAAVEIAKLEMSGILPKYSE